MPGFKFEFYSMYTLHSPPRLIVLYKYIDFYTSKLDVHILPIISQEGFKIYPPFLWELVFFLKIFIYFFLQQIGGKSPNSIAHI
jgi:hypothetical protein